MSIATDMATEWLAEVAAEPVGNPDQRRAERLGAGTAILAEIDDLRAQLKEQDQ